MSARRIRGPIMAQTRGQAQSSMLFDRHMAVAMSFVAW
jgi:hypothetical protein